MHTSHSIVLNEGHRLLQVWAKWHGQESDECLLIRLATTHGVLHTRFLSKHSKQTGASAARESQWTMCTLSPDSSNHCGAIFTQVNGLSVHLFTPQTQQASLEGTLFQLRLRRKKYTWFDMAHSIVYYQAWVCDGCCAITSSPKPLPLLNASRSVHIWHHMPTPTNWSSSQEHTGYDTRDCPSRTRDGWMGWQWQLLKKHPITLTSTPSNCQTPSLFLPLSTLTQHPLAWGHIAIVPTFLLGDRVVGMLSIHWQKPTQLIVNLKKVSLLFSFIIKRCVLLSVNQLTACKTQ